VRSAMGQGLGGGGGGGEINATGTSEGRGVGGLRVFTDPPGGFSVGPTWGGEKFVRGRSSEGV